MVLRKVTFFVMEVIILVEKTAPDGYTHSDEKLVYNITEDGKTYEAVLSNTRAKGQIKLSKEDSVTGKEPQGEATLEGAVYEVRAAENILDPADGSVLYKERHFDFNTYNRQ